MFHLILNCLKEGNQELSGIIPELLKAEEIRRHGKEVPGLARKMQERIKEKGWEKRGEEEIEGVGIDEKKMLEGEKEFLEREFSCRIEIYNADEVDAKLDPQNRRRMSMPTRPAIFVV